MTKAEFLAGIATMEPDEINELLTDIINPTDLGMAVDVIMRTGKVPPDGTNIDQLDDTQFGRGLLSWLTGYLYIQL